MSTLDLSRQAMRGEASAMAKLIRSLADDLYQCRSADLERTRAELERTLQESAPDRTHARAEIEALWELTHVFLSKVPLSLEAFLKLGSDSVESAILDLIESDEALDLEELCELSGLEQGAAQEGLQTLEKLGLVVPFAGEACRLTRDGREVRRWVASRDAAGKTPKRLEATLPAPARSKQITTAPSGEVDAAEASRRLVSGFDASLRAKLRLTSVRLRLGMRDRDALQQEFVHKRSLLRIAGSDVQALRPKEVAEVEAKVPRGSEVWVVGVTPPNGNAFFDVVADNIIHSSVQYFYVCPEKNFRRLWNELVEKCGKDHLGRRLACIMNAPELLRLDTARVHVLPDGKIRLMRVSWLGLERPEPFYLSVSTPAAAPNIEVLRSYRQAARALIASNPGSLPVLDFQKLEARVRSSQPEDRT